MFGQSLLSAFGSAACTTDTDQLFPATTFQSVATYQLNGNVNDLTGNYNGTQSGGTWETNGEFLGCWNSDGVSDEYLQASQPPNVKTVSAWVYVTGTPSNSVGAIVWTNGASSGPSVSYLLGLSDVGKIYAFGSYVGLTRTVTLNQWYHVAATYNAGTVKIYWEGTHVETRTTPYPSVVNGTQITIGRSFYTSNVHNFNGSIDQIRIYDRTLTSADITTLYNETVATSSTNITFEEYNGIAYYKMSDATDQLGNYNGTATNVNFNTEGKFGFAGAFNGSSSVIDIPTIPNITGSGSNFSFSAWINFDGSSGDRYIMSFRENSFVEIGFNSGYSPRKLEFKVNDGANKTVLVNESEITNNTWHHICLTAESSGNLTAYLDGTSKGTTAIGSIGNAGQQNSIGAYNTGTAAGYFTGKIDQIRIYDSALSAANVTTLYNEVYCVPTIVPTDYFEPVIYTGNGGTKSITSLNFAPDFTWIKNRGTTQWHGLYDSIRGASKWITSNATNAEADTAGTTLTSFNTDGFSLGNDSNGYGANTNNNTYVAWNWKAGGAAVSNTDGTITSQVSANVDAGFSVVKWTGNGADATIGHGIDTPELIIAKRTDSTGNWAVQVPSIGNGYLLLNSTIAYQGADPSVWNNTAPTSDVFTTAGGSGEFFNTGDFIAYCFHSVDGMSRVGTYTGNGSTTGTIVTLNFAPSFVMIKGTDQTSDWIMIDNKRDTTNPNSARIDANNSSAEYTGENIMDLNSNGFQLKTSSASKNGLNKVFIFMAIA